MSEKFATLTVLYNVPEAERANFDQQYFETHVRLAQKIPGLHRMDAAKKPKNMMGGESPYYLIATLFFDDLASLKAGMGSPEGKAAGANVMGFAADYITMLSSDTETVFTEADEKIDTCSIGSRA